MRLPLKVLISITVGLSLIAAFIPELAGWLALSRVGIEHLFLWQLISYCFVVKGPVSVAFFLSLFFDMYLLWMFGTHLIERSRARLFFTLYFGAVLLGGASALLFPNGYLAGSTNGVYAILVAWMLLNQNSKLLLFFALPFKSQWLILGLLGMTLLIDLSNAYWAGAVSLAVASVYSYLFTLVVWKEPGPFFFLRRYEKKLFQFLEKRKKHEKYASSKIFDIRSGEPILDDDQFMDAMLDRISRHGESSLTTAEKKRMKEISKRKSRV